ncbi:MAG: ricin-type beta-trefoil lectin domain protein [Pseudomonadota bacterium]|nr:ricin-type beta-trefoil lectin domain protein [Pseudomonadota bacterium]
MKAHLPLAAILLATAACSQGSQTSEAETATADTSANADAVEIALVDPLDSTTNEYCLDIAGGRENVDPANGLQGHTCYSYTGSLGSDQIFDASRIADGLLVMPEYDVCVSVSGTDISLAQCDENEAQKISFEEDGTIRPAATPDMCFTLATDTRSGKSDIHQIKALTVESCSDDSAERQTWRTRNSDDTPS